MEKGKYRYRCRQAEAATKCAASITHNDEGTVQAGGSLFLGANTRSTLTIRCQQPGLPGLRVASQSRRGPEEQGTDFEHPHIMLTRSRPPVCPHSAPQPPGVPRSETQQKLSSPSAPLSPLGDATETNSTWEQSQGTDTQDAGCWRAAVPKSPFASQGSPVLETNTIAILLQMGHLGKTGNLHEI